MRQVLVIPQVSVQNANALSSPYTIGFPAMTAFLGGIHALQRNLKIKNTLFNDLVFTGVGVACHRINLQTYKGKQDYVASIIATANPLNEKGERPSFIEEARCHLTVSLVIEYKGLSMEYEDEFITSIQTEFAKLKLASGDILGFGKLKRFTIDEKTDNSLRPITRLLMPSYVLIERRDLMIDAMQQGQDTIDALLDHLAIHHYSEKNEAGDVEWIAKRKQLGWIVPIATGFHGISELGQAMNQRDLSKPHRFAESVVTLGEFIMAYKINQLNEMLWHYHFDSKNNLYLCQQNK